MRYEEQKHFYKTKGFYVACFLGLFAILTVVGVQKNLREKLSNAQHPLAQADTTQAVSTTEAPESYASIQDEFQNEVATLPEQETIPKSDSAILGEPEAAAPAATAAAEEKTTLAKKEKKDPKTEVASGKTAANELPEEDAVAVLNAEEVNQGLTWPIDGEVLLTYSMDKPVYFETLGQYKCNPALIIAGSSGDTVTSACDCTITKVTRSEETGLTITAKAGDYTYIYGQLANPKVSKGDTVKEGDPIATLAEPSKSYQKEGCNLYFQVKEKADSINPLLLLK